MKIESYIPSTHLEYTKYNNGINLSYDDIKYIHGIYQLKTFKEILVPVTYPFGHGIYQVYYLVYAMSKRIRDQYRNFLESFELVYTMYMLYVVI